VIVGAYVEHAAPEHPAGAEWTMQDLMTWLQRRGHDCRVLAKRGHRRMLHDGVTIYSPADDDVTTQHYLECDVMLTQLEASRDAQLLAATYQTPLVQMIHSENQLVELGVADTARALVVFNAQHVANACAWWPGQSMVVHPPIDRARVLTEPGVCTTLVNLSHNKGGPLLVELAKILETRPFMGIVGVYEDQTLGPEGFPGTRESPTPTGLPANLRVFNPAERIADMLGYTRLLLVLSRSETYGRVAGEAMLSGIPVIASRTPGLEECCGDAARWVERRDDLRALARIVEAGYDQATWDEWSEAAIDQAWLNEERQQRELEALEAVLVEIATRQPEMTL
jgi:hypothetical protein